MANVIHRVAIQYGTYAGTTQIYCDENDDLETIKAKVRKQEKLDFLAMAYYSVEIIATRHLSSGEENAGKF